MGDEKPWLNPKQGGLEALQGAAGLDNIMIFCLYFHDDTQAVGLRVITPIKRFNSNSNDESSRRRHDMFLLKRLRLEWQNRLEAKVPHFSFLHLWIEWGK